MYLITTENSPQAIPFPADLFLRRLLGRDIERIEKLVQLCRLLNRAIAVKLEFRNFAKVAIGADLATDNRLGLGQGLDHVIQRILAAENAHRDMRDRKVAAYLDSRK